MIKGIIFDWMGTLYQRNKGPFPFVKDVLTELKQKYKLGIVSLAKTGVEARKAELADSGIIEYFDSVIVTTEKTPEEYLRCMREMKTTTQTTAIVDDRTLRGIMIGNKIGCQTYWIQKGEYSHELPNKNTGEPTHKIDTVEDLLEYL